MYIGAVLKNIYLIVYINTDRPPISPLNTKRQKCQVSYLSFHEFIYTFNQFYLYLSLLCIPVVVEVSFLIRRVHRQSVVTITGTMLQTESSTDNCD